MLQVTVWVRDLFTAVCLLGSFFHKYVHGGRIDSHGCHICAESGKYISLMWQALLLPCAHPEPTSSQPGGGKHCVTATVRLTPARIYAGTAIAVAAASAAVIPAGPTARQQSPGAVRAALRALRLDNDMAALLAHGALADAAADVLAQAVAVDSARGRTATADLDWRRVRRSTLAALVSDDIPFLLWARLLHEASHRYVLAARRVLSPPLARALTHPASLAATKALLSQIVYESATAVAYLGLQAYMRGGGAAEAWAEVRAKFWRVWVDGLAFFSATYLVVFALPHYSMQVVVDNIASLVFNMYLSHVSHRKRGPPVPHSNSFCPR